MKIQYVIFYLDTSKLSDTTDVDFLKIPNFPRDWQHIGSSKFYTEKNQEYDFLECPSLENAVSWIKGHLRSNHIYKICKWSIEENIKVFDNCPELVEVETE